MLWPPVILFSSERMRLSPAALRLTQPGGAHARITRGTSRRKASHKASAPAQFTQILPLNIHK
jgi:hypothetical protein